MNLLQLFVHLLGRISAQIERQVQEILKLVLKAKSQKSAQSLSSLLKGNPLEHVICHTRRSIDNAAATLSRPCATVTIYCVVIAKGQGSKDDVKVQTSEG